MAKYTSTDVFLQAVFFDHAADVLWRDAEPGLTALAQSGRQSPPRNDMLPPATIPQAVNCALAVELYLKAFVKLEGGTFKRNHILTKLFGTLTPSRQKRIEELHAEAAGDPPLLVGAPPGAAWQPPSFADLLTHGEDVIARLRYAYERDSPWSVLGLGHVCLACRRAAFEANQQWEVLWRRLCTPPTSPSR